MGETRANADDPLPRRVREAVELLRPHPHRGDLIAAGAVPVAVAVLLVNVRLDERWGTGALLVVTGLACALVLGMGVLAPLEGARPRPYQLVLQLCGLALLLVTLLRLAQALGVQEPLDAAGSAFWILALLAAAAAWLARERRSAICALIAGVAGTVALVAFVAWAFSPQGPGTSRWILLLAALAAGVGALLLRERHRRESVYLVDAAGVAVLLIGVTFVADLLSGPQLGPFGDLVEAPRPGAGWKLLLLAAGLGLVAYAGVDREPGPGWIGTLVLLVFVLLVGEPGEGGPSLWFWPLALLIAGGAMIAAGLRPRRPLPPEPAPPGRPAAVVSATRPRAQNVSEPPASGSLWARDRSEQPTRPHRPVAPPDPPTADA